MRILEYLLNVGMRTFFRIACKLDFKELRKIPRKGPGVLIGNHTSMVEPVLLVIFTRPRRVIGLGKKEIWDNPIMRFAMNAWRTIPLDRQKGFDRAALDACFDVLRRGNFLGLAPEGTRSKNGMRQAKGGATFIALKGGAPIWPIAQWGSENFGSNLKRLRRTPVHIRVGEPFTVEVPGGGKPSAEDRQAMTDEMMYRVSMLLPEHYRGFYSDFSKATTKYLRFISSE